MSFDEIAKELAALKAELEAARNERDVARQEARDAELESAEEMEMMETAFSGIEAKLARALADANQAKEDRDLLRIELSSVKCKLGVAEATIAGLRSDDFQRPGVPSTIRGWQRAAHALAVEKGWHPEDGPDPRDPNRALAWLMLASSELAEAAEEVRAGRWEQWTEESGKPAGVGVEVADCVIRLLDSCEAWGIDLQARIEDKHEYNKARPHRLCFAGRSGVTPRCAGSRASA